MLRVVGVVGYKDSGKTTLTHALAHKLTSRGYEVGIIKHTHHSLDLPGKDTATLGESVAQVGVISPQESGVFWKTSLSLESIISHFKVDIILIEGFKMEKTYPKIACLRGEPDDGNLFDGLTICAVGPADRLKELHVPSCGDLEIPLFSWDDGDRIADVVEQKAFKLPKLDCGDCGRERCYDMAREIVAGTGSWEECVAL